MDFTPYKYKELLSALREAGYTFVTFEDYCSGVQAEHVVIMRHDVDRRADLSLRMAQLEASMGVRASYYFRIVPESNQPQVIQAIAALGHEIGYHYEDLSLASGNRSQAIALFEEHLNYFRHYYPVRTICMHGSPTSRYDGRDLWKDYDYHTYGVIGEPYFDIDYRAMLYLTDTGRRWDGYKVSVRDKVVQQEEWCERHLVFHSTDDILVRLRTDVCGLQHAIPHLMLTTHPQRWTDQPCDWLKEWGLQHIKNGIKRLLIWVRKS